MTDHTDESAIAPATERTVAFFADPRAASLLLTETVEKLIESLGIQRGLVDLSTIPGLAVASAFESAGVPFDSLVFGQQDHFEVGSPDRHPVYQPVIASDAERLRALAERVTELPVGELGSVNANVVVIPAMVGPDEKLLDFSQGTLVGAVVTQLEEAQRDLVLVDAPERGLRGLPDGTYQRAVIHVGSTSSNA